MHTVFRLLLCAVFAGLCRLALAQDGGFVVDDHLLSAEQKTSMLPIVHASMEVQARIIAAAGLPPAVLDFFHGVRIVVDPDLRGNPGVYTTEGGEGVVRIRPVMLAADRPILLHELLHAYHFKVLGPDNAEIERAYRKAKGADAYPAEYRAAHFLSSAREYFAVTGTIYLVGKIQQPPFQCERLATLDADYLAFLARQFGAHACR